MGKGGSENKVDTKLFVSTGDVIGIQAKALEGCFQDWAKVMQGLRGSWQGNSSDDIKNTVESVQRSASDLLQSLGGYKTVLYEMAGIYDKTEQSVKESGKSLKFNKTLR